MHRPVRVLLSVEPGGLQWAEVLRGEVEVLGEARDGGASVDVSDAPKTVTRTRRGVSDRSAQGYAQAAHAASSPVRLALGHIASPDFSAVVPSSLRIVPRPRFLVNSAFVLPVGRARVG